MRALPEVVQAGKVRHPGCVQHVCLAVRPGAAHRRGQGWTRFASMQNHDKPAEPEQRYCVLLLVCGEETREMIPSAWIRTPEPFLGVRWRAPLAGTREGPSSAPFGQAITRSRHASHGTAPDGIMQE
jgi:hypothetical protein